MKDLKLWQERLYDLILSTDSDIDDLIMSITDGELLRLVETWQCVKDKLYEKDVG